jgi:ammonia channel protein AmtB
VHACGGALGVLVAGLASERRFASPQPYPLYDGVAKQLPIQIAFVLFVATVSGVCGFLFLKAFR